MASNMDVDASTVIYGEPLSAVGERVYETLLAVADGRRTAAEQRRLEEFAINEITPAELGQLSTGAGR
jgi:altronate dehydratase large subunit